MSLAPDTVEAPAPETAAAARRPAQQEEEAASLLPPAAAATGGHTARRRAWQVSTRLLLAATLAVALLAAGACLGSRRRGGKEASPDTGVSLWSAPAQTGIAPVTSADRFAQSPGHALAAPPNCVVSELPPLWPYEEQGAQVEVKLLTYNLFWWNLYGLRRGNNGSASRLIAQAGLQRPHDILAFQECMDPARVLRDAGLASEYMAFSGDGSGTAAICTAFRRRSWALLGSGRTYVAEDSRSQYFGRRAAQWMRVRHIISGRTLFVVNHHGPLPVNSGGQCGGAATAFNLLQIIKHHSHRGDAVILVGDFNADASSETIQRLQQRLTKAYTGTAVNGIDNIFSNLGATAVVAAANLGSAGSDHDALSVTLALGSRPLPPAAPASVLAPVRPPPAAAAAALRGAAAAAAAAVAANPQQAIVQLK